ncbi:MAG TPA: endonuclease/exonuclease/phosphatase family protein [Kamptonema sp.]|nr:endonuclease/exonuclease/phosphatase family protein [Kamptonema sp.]
MDDVIRKIITLGFPALLLFKVADTTGKTGESAIAKSLEKLGSPLGLLMGLAILVIVGLAASYFSRYLVDGLLVRFYQQRQQSEPLEKLLIEIDKLLLSEDLKIKLKWTITHPQNHRQPQFKDIISRSFIIAAILSGLLSVSSYLGGNNRFFELSSHFRLQYLIVAFSCCIFFKITRTKKLWLFVSILCVLVNFAEILPWYFPQRAIAAEIAGQKLRIFQSNVLTGNRRYADVISLVREEKPDIAVFVEVTQSTWAKELAVLKDLLPYSFGNQDSEQFGMVIYSKFPLENTSLKTFSWGRKVVYAEVIIQSKVISILAAHPPVPTKQKSFLDRNRQLAAIGNYVAMLKNPVMVIGDFNVTMWSPFYKNMIKTGGLRNARASFGILPTWPTDKPLFYIPIDHCLVSKEIQVLNIRAGRKIGSDHLPLITDLAINNH